MIDILDHVRDLINGTKREEYGEIHASFGRIAELWGIILNRSITSTEIALCMIAFKLAREVEKHKQDNIIDILGYAYCLALLNNEGNVDA